MEKRTGKVDWSRIKTEALKFQAKEFAFHLVGHREPLQVTPHRMENAMALLLLCNVAKLN